MFFRSDSGRPVKQQRTSLRRNRHPRRDRQLGFRGLGYEPLESRQVLATFQPMGPAAIINGQVEKVTPNNEVSGAIHTVLTHPNNANVMYIGAVNGGIWRTTNALQTRPTWVPLTDHLPSLSIGAMDMDPANPARIVAGIGNYSSFAEGGNLTGLILTEDAGATWTVIDDPLLVGKNISGVTIRGDLILASAGGGFFGSSPNPDTGLFRSTDGGVTWQNIELLDRDANFPDEPVEFEVFDLVADPSPDNTGRYYAAVAETGIFRTDDGGANWTNVTSGSARITDLFNIIANNNLDNNNIEMAVASNGRIYMTVITVGQPVFIAYSDSGGGTWTEMDVPLTQEATGIVGVSPRAKPGGQGNIHFSIIVDPTDPYTVYVAGDRQDGDLSFDNGNSIGARNFTGKLFRGDTRRASVGNVLNLAGFIPFNGYSPQWEHLTHSNLIPEMPEGGTRRGSAPHADSREMAFDAAGNLIEVDDGGIYRRTLPRSNQGDWFSINGNLQITELHNIAYDAVSNILVGGSQDNGSVQQISSNSQIWEQISLDAQEIIGIVSRSSAGDGGDVAVDDTSNANFSYRYTSSQGLGGFRRQVYDRNNQLVREDTLINNIIGNFVTPVILNKSLASRMVIGGTAGIFESFDRGDSFREIRGPNNASFGILGADQTAIVAGGSRGGVANPALLYVGSGAEVFVRTNQADNLRLTRAQYPGGIIRDLAVDNADWANVYVIDRDDVYVSSDTGDSWRRVTGNLINQGASELRSLEFVRSGSGEGFLVAGTNTGVYVTSDRTPGNWIELGNLPNAPVFDLEYDAADNVLAVGTMGRGAFLLTNAYAHISGTAADSDAGRSVTGLIWNDLDGDGVRDVGEPGLQHIRVYVDTNGDNEFNINEPSAVSAANGVYTISGIPRGTYATRTQLQPGWKQTSPAGNGELVNNFIATPRASGFNFGVWEGRGSEMGFDFGDAPLSFPTRLVDNGASHGIVPGFHLGATVDGDLDGFASPFAGGDDSVNDDEDGVTFLTDMIPGRTATVRVVVANGQQPPGVLQAWIDFNGDGSWGTPGEQVLRDAVVREGVNDFQIMVPTWATEGFKISRFRYGYERGISYTGRAVAGEVEDHLVEVSRGGPTANDDSYVVRRNSSSNQLTVLTNDAIRLGSGAAISAVTTPSQGGTVRIASNGGSLLYTPRPEFTGTETFSYTVTDADGISDSASVSVFVQPDLATIRLGATSESGEPISSVAVGQTFLLSGYVRDLTPEAGGVFAAYFDIEFPGAAATVAGPITFGPDFPNSQSGITSTPGLIDEVGAFDGLDRLGPAEALLFTVPVRATSAGNVTFTTNPADVLPQHNVLLFDRNDPVPTDQIEFRSLSLNFVQVISAQTNPRNSLDVNDDTAVSPVDALLVINQLNDVATLAARPAGEGEQSAFLDVNGDGFVTPLDALLVINELNRMSQSRIAAASVAAAVDAMGEGEPAEIGSMDPTISGTQPADSAAVNPVLVDPQAHAEVFETWSEKATAGSSGDSASLDSILAMMGDDLDQRGS